MFKKNVIVSRKKRLLLSLFLFSWSGVLLFILSAFLYPQFVLLVDALTSKNSALNWLYAYGWTITLLIGLLWLCLLLVFDAAKAELLA
ncbi:MAG: hypothetical protein WBL62_03990 [Gallionella sp.]